MVRGLVAMHVFAGSRAIQLQHNTPGYHGSHSVHLEYDVLVLELRVGGETEEQCVVIVLSICCTPLYDSVLTVSAFGDSSYSFTIFFQPSINMF